MNFHIERPELNAQTNEENIAKVDTWIADTADKLNLALSAPGSTKTESTGSATSGSNNAVSAEIKKLEARAVYLGEYCVETTQLSLGG